MIELSQRENDAFILQSIWTHYLNSHNHTSVLSPIISTETHVFTSLSFL